MGIQNSKAEIAKVSSNKLNFLLEILSGLPYMKIKLQASRVIKKKEVSVDF